MTTTGAYDEERVKRIMAAKTQEKATIPTPWDARIAELEPHSRSPAHPVGSWTTFHSDRYELAVLRNKAEGYQRAIADCADLVEVLSTIEEAANRCEEISPGWLLGIITPVLAKYEMINRRNKLREVK